MSRIKGTTKNKGQKDGFDRFYTNVSEAQRLFELMLSRVADIDEDCVFLEPSAGDGAFVYAMEQADVPVDHIIALDIAPAALTQCSAKIHRHDFISNDFYAKLDSLGITRPSSSNRTVIVGNPPFGEQCKLAIEFVNRALELGRYCAFILPMSFYKETIQSKLSGRVIEIVPIENTDYRVGDETVSVPSAFFIIDGEQEYEPLPDYSDKLPLTRVPQSKRGEADFAIRRIGGTTGKARTDIPDITYIDGHYFYKRDADCPDDIIDIINSCEFPERDWSVGPRSLSSKEIAKNIYEKLMEMGMIDSAD